jgi:Uma2 family endonuclease
MVDVLENPTRRELIARYAQPAPLPGGYAPEQRLVFGGVGWTAHLELDEALGHDCPGPRLYYLDGDLEIMSTSEEHERIKKWIGFCVDDYLLDQGIANMPRGEATMRFLEEAGAEPDESWCIGAEKPVPDIVLEVALTSGGLPKLEIYGRFPVPEVWIWRRGRLEIHGHRGPSRGYGRSAESRLLPGLPIAAIEAAVEERDVLKMRRAFRAALS